MPKSLKIQELATPETAAQPVLQSVKKSKLPVLLVTEDDSLWPQVGADLGSSLILKQLDSVDELVNSTPSAQAAIYTPRALPSLRSMMPPAPMRGRFPFNIGKLSPTSPYRSSRANCPALSTARKTK
jgi:hypothetical protein